MTAVLIPEITREQEVIAHQYALTFGECEVIITNDDMHIECERGVFTYNPDGVQTGGAPMPEFTLEKA